jgi:hypothetical protein
MNRRELIIFREHIDHAIQERKHLGEYDANSQYINKLLELIATLVDHAIDQAPKPGRKVLPGRGED